MSCQLPVPVYKSVQHWPTTQSPVNVSISIRFHTYTMDTYPVGGQQLRNSRKMKQKSKLKDGAKHTLDRMHFVE